MFHVTINGTKHCVTVKNGESVYDPPIPSESKEKYRKKCQDMLKSRTAPGHRTDTSFHSGRGTLLSQLEGDVNWTNHIVKQAKKRGYNVGANDAYIGQLDDLEGGNPNAFFKTNEGLSEMKRRLTKLGKGVDMPGLYVAPNPDNMPKPKALNSNVCKKLMSHYKQTGEASGMTDIELKSYVEKKHGRPVKK